MGLVGGKCSGGSANPKGLGHLADALHPHLADAGIVPDQLVRLALPGDEGVGQAEGVELHDPVLPLDGYPGVHAGGTLDVARAIGDAAVGAFDALMKMGSFGSGFAIGFATVWFRIGKK